MNTIWSTYVQRIDTLYSSRILRFHDLFKEQYMNAFKIENAGNLLELGCGPSALSMSLHRWYPTMQITATDRDTNFIEFSKSLSKDILFQEEDVTSLSFEDNTFDVTISNTVQEHVEPSKFFSEQYRVLKTGGVCLVLSARRGVTIDAPCIVEETVFEKEIWSRVEQRFNEINNRYTIGAYRMSEDELPKAMEQYGFKNISVEYCIINLTPDNPTISKQMALDIINSNKVCSLDSIDSMYKIASDLVSIDEITKLKKLINNKYDKRIELYEKGIKQWDTSTSLTMIIRGTKK